MKEGAPEEIDGIDVTNVPVEYQENFLANARDAQRQETNVSAAQAALEVAKQIRNQHTAVLADGGALTEEEFTSEPGYQVYTSEVKDARSAVRGAQRGVNDAIDFARDFVEETPDIEVARAEMERALKKDIKEKLDK